MIEFVMNFVHNNTSWAMGIVAVVLVLGANVVVSAWRHYNNTP